MRIAIFSDNFYPELSGISDSIILLAKELAKLGHEICFYVPKYVPKNYRAINLPVKELELGDRIYIKRLFSLPAPFAGLQARLAVPFLTPGLFDKFKPEVIHSQLFFGAGLEGMIRARLAGLPLVGTNHTAITEFIKVVPFNSKVLKKIGLDYSVWYYNHCNFVTAPSQSVFKEMGQYGFRCPHQVVSNPIDTGVFSLGSDKPALKQQFKLSNKTIVFAGRLASEKNIDVVIRAVALARKRFKDINLAIAGTGKYEPELRQLAKDLNIEKEVKFFGTISQLNLAKLYQASEIFSIASTSDTQSLTLMQAMATGLPAVVVDSRALPEYVNKQNGYVVPVGAHEAMAEKFIQILENEELRRKLSQGAYNYVQQFSAANIAKEWEKLYKKAIENNKK